MIKKFSFKILFILYVINNTISAQIVFNFNSTKKLIEEKQSFHLGKNEGLLHPFFTINYNQYFFINSNLPNLENHNGLYFPKGYGTISGMLIKYSNQRILLSAEPFTEKTIYYNLNLERKKSQFSVLNDVPLQRKNFINENIRNLGFIINSFGYSVGYGNWNLWWGPGIHTSLTMSNNARGFAHKFIGTNGYRRLFGNIDYKIKYIVSDNLQTNRGPNYFLSAYFANFKYKKNIEFGISRNVMSGGNPDVSWDSRDALSVIFTDKNIKYWDQIIDYYIKFNFPRSGLIAFLNIGYPNHSYGENNYSKIYNDHAKGSNVGMRKYGAFGFEQILFGFEYTRLVQSIYYNKLPSPNWYDNNKYNYWSYKGRRWGAHSGSDSDDLLIYFGYLNDNTSFIYGLNYERHGVTYHFPPEVKFESRINITFKYKNSFIYINYENEYFEHYGFVDINKNVWEETFNAKSLQRTNTLLIGIEKALLF